MGISQHRFGPTRCCRVVKLQVCIATRQRKAQLAYALLEVLKHLNGIAVHMHLGYGRTRKIVGVGVDMYESVIEQRRAVPVGCGEFSQACAYCDDAVD
ncbi:hypothetical protein PG2T_05975 [Immundisolibacter cernigliae]|uniref:Uncharacterized protein n=1 Tax=Immundisolibacter cernigliae TaxID=1810504 RepID=A0A1B1YSR3_9GAMM|nr:hypothetical protein PG2T_05975 [Immundisolibacter cernigliae]